MNDSGASPKAIDAKLRAETAEIEARTQRAARLFEHSEERSALRLEHLRLEIRHAKAKTAAEELGLASVRRSEAEAIADWKNQHSYLFNESVTGASVQKCIDRLHLWAGTSPACDIEVIFNSPGGAVIDGMALFDYIRFLRGQGHKITIVALGYAASMAGILLQAGDVRVMARGSWLLIHEVSFGASGTIGQVEDQFKFGERLKQQAADIFIERSNGKLTRKVLAANWTRKDWWLSPDEALALGLIDEVR